MINGEKKGSTLYVLEILRKYTDRNHSLTYSQILDKLDSEYEVKLERKTIARDIDILSSLGYEIIKRGNYGVYLGFRDFEEGELRFLIDAIYSSRSMPTKYARELVDKLTKDHSIYDKRKYKHLEKIDDDVRTDSRQIFLNIELLDEAISEGKKVEFQYNSYGTDKKLSPKKDGKIYKINPYYLVNTHGNYYLVCNYDKYENLGNYKVENITNLKILDEPVKPLNFLPGQENFSIKDYLREHIYMNAGDSVDAKIKIEDEARVNDIVSWFGNKIGLYFEGGNLYAQIKVNEDSLIYWALQYGQSVEVVEPLSTRNKILNILDNMLKKYKK